MPGQARLGPGLAWPSPAWAAPGLARRVTTAIRSGHGLTDRPTLAGSDMACFACGRWDEAAPVPKPSHALPNQPRQVSPGLAKHDLVRDHCRPVAMLTDRATPGLAKRGQAWPRLAWPGESRKPWPGLPRPSTAWSMIIATQSQCSRTKPCLVRPGLARTGKPGLACPVPGQACPGLARPSQA